MLATRQTLGFALRPLPWQSGKKWLSGKKLDVGSNPTMRAGSFLTGKTGVCHSCGASAALGSAFLRFSHTYMCVYVRTYIWYIHPAFNGLECKAQPPLA